MTTSERNTAPTDAMWKAYKRVLAVLKPLPQRTRSRVLRAAVILLGLDDPPDEVPTEPKRRWWRDL